MTELADLYLQLGSAGFIALLFGFMIYNLIQSQKEQSEDLEEIKQSIHKMENVLDQSMGINVKLILKPLFLLETEIIALYFLKGLSCNPFKVPLVWYTLFKKIMHFVM